jgi:hypothetical protein
MRIKNDVNGNPRYVVHFLDILNDDENKDFRFMEKYELAVSKAKKFGGKVYRGKDFGGGIVFQSYDINGLLSKLK